jgi:hypothetical protein
MRENSITKLYRILVNHKLCHFKKKKFKNHIYVFFHFSSPPSMSNFCTLESNEVNQARWLTPVILVTQEVKIRRIAVQGQAGQKVSKTPSQPIKLSGVGCDWQPSCEGSINRRVFNRFYSSILIYEYKIHPEYSPSFSLSLHPPYFHWYSAGKGPILAFCPSLILNVY